MSSEERKRILKMVEDGKITADQALVLIKELEQDSDEEEFEASRSESFASPGTEAGTPSESGSASEFERTAARVRGLWQIPFWIGLAIMVLSALGIYFALLSGGYNFWFYCLWLPFALGVLVMAAAGWSRSAHWLFVNVQRPPHEDGPKRIFLGFPLPLGLAGWFLRVFGNRIHGLKNTNVDEVVEAISISKSIKEPLIVNVDEGDDGERVQVFIG